MPDTLVTSGAAVPTRRAGQVWRTKGPAFWSLLSAMLIKLRPGAILELGGGRSTTFLADYAWKFEKEMVTFEESPEWHRTISDDLRRMGIEREIAHHLPLDDISKPYWYAHAKAERLVKRAVWDLVFVDGPQRMGRRNERGQQLILEAAKSARMIIVDDVHRGYNMDYFNELSARFAPEHKFIFRYRPNLLGIAVTGEWGPTVRDCFDFLEIPYTQETQSADAADGSDDDE